MDTQIKNETSVGTLPKCIIVSRQSGSRDDAGWGDIDDLPEIREETEDLDDLER